MCVISFLLGDDPRTCAHSPQADGLAVKLARLRLTRDFAVVGDTGRFTESVWLLAHALGVETLLGQNQDREREVMMMMMMMTRVMITGQRR